MTKYEQLVEALRECANWIEAVSASSQYAHDELMALAYADKLRDAADAIEVLQAEVAFYKKRVCESCGVCPDDMSDPNNCEIAGHGMWVGVNPLVDSVQCSICGGMLYSKELETPYCPYCGAKMNDSNASNAFNALDNAQDGPIITPCRGCSDYDGYGGCKSKGGCARAKMEAQDGQ